MKDGEPESGKGFEAENLRQAWQYNIVDNDEKVDSVSGGLCSSTAPKFEAGDGIPVAEKVLALNSYLAVLDSRMSGLESHLAQMEQGSQQSLRGIEALLRATLQNTAASQ